MTERIDTIVRVGLAGWVGEGQWDAARRLGTIGDDLCLLEIGASLRERVLVALIDGYDVDDRNLRVEIVFFGQEGGVHATSINSLDLWPKTASEVPTEVFIENYYKVAFTTDGDQILVSVRHALRPSAGPPRRQFRFAKDQYEQAISHLTSESRCLCDDLLAVARQRAPEKVESLQTRFAQWPD